MMRISFTGYDQNVLTMAGSGLKPGDLVKVGADASADIAGNGEAFFGQVVTSEKSYAGIQTRGFAQVGCDASVTTGYVPLVADGNGGVKKDGDGREMLVLYAENGQAGIFLG